MTLKAGKKYLKNCINLIFIFFIAFFLSKSKFIPSGAHPRTLVEIFEFVIKDSKSQNYQFTEDYILQTKDYKSGVYPLILNSIYSKDKRPKVIVLIIAESLGIVEDKDLASNIEELFQRKLNSALNITSRNDFKLFRLKDELSPGGTIRMEYLTLCNNFKKSEKELFSNCLPNILKNNNNWKSMYMHSPSLDFYNRKNIMKKFGFNELFSQRQKLIKEGNLIKQVKLCLSRNFCAPSDKELFASALKKIKAIKNKNLFINILTVDAHGPYRSENFLNPTNEYDNYYQKVKMSISQISYFVKNLLKTNENKKLEIYIVSDHPPVLTSFNKKGNLNYSFLIKNFN